MLTAIILAAGNSTRMGFPKALLRDAEGETFVARVASSLWLGGLRDIVVVTGRDHDAVSEALSSARDSRGVRIVRNEDPSRGQLSSLWAGLDACPPDAEALAVTLVDVPMLAPSTVAAVVDEWTRSRAPIVRPEYRGRRGHPVIFDRTLFEELRQAPLESGARVVVSAHYQEIVNVPVEDPGCVEDVDTPEEYERVRRQKTEDRRQKAEDGGQG